MPKINIKSQSSESPQPTYDKVKDFLQNKAQLNKVDPSLSLSFNDDTKTGRAEGKMFKADLSIAQNSSGSTVELIIDLPLSMGLMKGMIQKQLQQKLDEALS